MRHNELKRKFEAKQLIKELWIDWVPIFQQLFFSFAIHLMNAGFAGRFISPIEN